MASTNDSAGQEVLQRTSVELDLSDLDLNMLAELEGTALGSVLQQLQDMREDVIQFEQQPGQLHHSFSSHSSHHSFSSFSAFSAFSSFSSHSSWTWIL